MKKERRVAKLDHLKGEAECSPLKHSMSASVRAVNSRVNVRVTSIAVSRAFLCASLRTPTAYCTSASYKSTHPLVS